MPLEIKELYIKATVEDAPQGGGPTKGGSNDGNSEERIIRACVEQVMEIIKEAKER